MLIESWDTTYAAILTSLRNHDPVSFAKWGDGEWTAVLHVDPKWGAEFSVPSKYTGCEKRHALFADMCSELHGVLRSKPGYMLGVSPHMLTKAGAAIDEFVSRYGLGDLRWANANALHSASREGQLREFSTLISEQRPLLVGPAHISPMCDALRASGHVVTMSKDCWLGMAVVLASAREAAARTRCIIVSASIPAKWLIHKLHEEFGRTHSIIDAGSLWDVYVGIKSRGYHKYVDINQLRTT